MNLSISETTQTLPENRGIYRETDTFPFLNLYQDLQLAIAGYLTWRDVRNLSLVCKKLQGFAQLYLMQHTSLIENKVNTALKIDKLSELFKRISLSYDKPIQVSIKRTLARSEFTKLINRFSCISTLEIEEQGNIFRFPSIFRKNQKLECFIKHLHQVIKSDGLSFNNESLAYILEKQNNLQCLELTNVQHITDKAFLKIPEHTSLKRLTLTNSSITAEGIAQILAKFPYLTSLDLSGSCNIKPQYFDLPNRKFGLKELHLEYTTIYDEMLVQLLEHTPNLQILNLSNCENVSEKYYQKLWQFTNLKSLSIRRSQCSDNTLHDIVTQCSQIEHLDLNSCFSLTNSGLSKIQQLQHLKSLSICCTNIDWITLEQILKNCPKLEDLNALYCNHLFAAQSYTLPYHPNLRSVDFSYSLRRNTILIGKSQAWPKCNILTL